MYQTAQIHLVSMVVQCSCELHQVLLYYTAKNEHRPMCVVLGGMCVVSMLRQHGYLACLGLPMHY